MSQKLLPFSFFHRTFSRALYFSSYAALATEVLAFLEEYKILGLQSISGPRKKVNLVTLYFCFRQTLTLYIFPLWFSFPLEGLLFLGCNGYSREHSPSSQVQSIVVMQKSRRKSTEKAFLGHLGNLFQLNSCPSTQVVSFCSGFFALRFMASIGFES